MNFGALNGIAVNGSPLDANVRSSVVGYCYAVSAPAGTYYPMGIKQAFAQATVDTHYKQGSPGVYQASAGATPFGRCRYRSVASGVASVNASPAPTYYPRTYVSRPVYGLALASATVSAHTKARSLVDGVASANAIVVPHYKARSPVSGIAEAVGYIGSTSTIKYKWDFPSDTRFVVPYINNRFTVR